MLFDGISLTEQSKATNLTVDSGLTFPSNPNIGELFFKSDEMSLYSHNGTAWTKLLSIKDSIYDISLSYPSGVSGDETIMIFSVPRSMKLLTSASMYSGISLQPSATQSIFTIFKNGTEFGTITFAPNSSSAVFSITAETSFAQFDTISITAPSNDPHGKLSMSFKAILLDTPPAFG